MICFGQADIHLTYNLVFDCMSMAQWKTTKTVAINLSTDLSFRCLYSLSLTYITFKYICLVAKICDSSQRISVQELVLKN